MSKEFSMKDVESHSSKKDLHLVIHDKVYNVSSFVDEHPGGEEVLLDVGGSDATEAFEDVGHSDEAREILEGLKVGTVKREAGEAKPKGATNKVSAGPTPSSGSGPANGIMVYLILVVGAALAYGGYAVMK